jgi:DNA-binding NarL/FixJ family response regulator
MSGIEGVRKIRAWMPRIDIIMLTIREDDDAVFGSLCAGACGYITKKFKPGDILEAIKEIRAGGAPMSSQIARRVVQSFQATGHSILSQRETEVLNLLAKGYSYKMIAQALFISSTTVNSHLKSIYKKLEVHSEAQAIVEAVKRKLIIV